MKTSVLIKSAMKKLDYVYDFIKNMQEAKKLSRKLKVELNRNEIDVKAARELIKEINDYLQAANIARGKVRDTLAILAQILNTKKESFITEDNPFYTIMKMLKKPGIRIVKRKLVKRDDGSRLFYVVLKGRNGKMRILFNEEKGIASVRTKFKNDPLGYNSKRLVYNLTKEDDLKDLEYLVYYLNKEDENDLETGVEFVEYNGDCMLIDKKITEDGLKVELVKCGEKYIIFINNDQKYGVYDDELEARNEFDDF